MLIFLALCNGQFLSLIHILSNPNRFPVCDASTFHAFMILSTWSTDCVTFVPLIVANCMNCLEAVSYTHLDVYKRQQYAVPEAASA